MKETRKLYVWALESMVTVAWNDRRETLTIPSKGLYPNQIFGPVYTTEELALENKPTDPHETAKYVLVEVDLVDHSVAPPSKDKYNQYLSTYSGKDLLKKHSLNEHGTWVIYGEDPDCDLGGHHSQPLLGYREGKLDDVISEAVQMPLFWQWGAGGNIRKVEISKVG